MNILIYIFPVLAVCISHSAFSKDANLEEYVASIGSAEQIKEALKALISEPCGTGSCFNNNATEVCSLVGALDVKLGNLITNTNPHVTPKPTIAITNSDLLLMRRIWKQCKPSNYQYWNYGAMLHVIYDPAPNEEAEIQKLLRAKK